MPELDAIATAQAVHEGQLSAREVVEHAIAQIEKHNPELNAVVAQRFEAALEEVDAGLPEGPLRGVPTLVKDLGMQVAGLPASRGSRLWHDDVAQVDSELVRRYRRAGMVVLGMTNTPELGKNASTEPLLHGPTRNPWRHSHSVGGSSGGSAAAVASGMVPVAHGNDGGGSLRIPAAMCGLLGLKPSRGRVTACPDPAVLAAPLAVNHALTRTVRDSALLLDIASAPLPGAAVGTPGAAGSFLEQASRAPGSLRIGLVISRWDSGDVDPQSVHAARAAARLCEELGHRVEEVELGHDADRAGECFATLMAVGLVAQVQSRLHELGRDLREDDLEPFTRLLYEHYRTSLTAVAVHDALCDVQTTGWEVGRHFHDHDVLLSPTVAVPVPELGVLDTSRPETMWQLGSDYSAFTSLFNVTGMPALSLPLGLDREGLPIGVQLVGDLGTEGLLLALAATIEQAAPWPQVAPGYER